MNRHFPNSYVKWSFNTAGLTVLKRKTLDGTHKLKTTFLLAVACVTIFHLAGCATPYQSNGFTGGFSETQLAPDVFRVYFCGNGYTSGERVQDFALLRASELSLQHSFKYFAILEQNNSVKSYSYSTPGEAYTTGSVDIHGNTATFSGYTTYEPGKTYTFYKPKTGLLIQCFAEKPDGIYTFDASFLQQSLKQKYKIK